MIALVAALFFLPFLGGVHLFDWDEINFAEISREMIVLGDYLRISINFEPFFQKPPLFFWMQVLAMKTIGIGDYAARLPNALCGIATLVILYRIGKQLYDYRFGLLWAGAYLGSVLPFLYFKSGIIDPWFNLFIFLGLYYFILFYWKKENQGLSLTSHAWSYLFWGGFLLGLGILTKGPVAFLLVALTLFVYWVYQRFRFFVSIPQFLFFTLAACLVTGAWFGVETWLHGPQFVKEFTIYQYRLFSTPDAGHGGFPGYHFVVLLFGCFPASIFALRAFGRQPAEEQAYQQDFRRWMKYLFWVVLILFTIVKSKIVHYSSLAYFPLTYLAALTLYKIQRGEISFTGWMRGLLWGIGGVYALIVLLIPFLAQHLDRFQDLVADPFARGNMEATVTWTGVEAIPAVVLVLVLVMSTRYLRQQQLGRGIQWLFGGTAVFVFLTLIFFIKRIEGYSQRAAVEFWESHEGKDVYLMTHGFKSYAPYYYGRVQPGGAPQRTDKEWLLRGNIDREVYITTKVHKADELRGIPGLEELGGKNGFIFFRRRVPIAPFSE
ncbi:MAG: glycosyltransferase family 39 protein [Lewinellaceae bacterium]|nr:glycosyltransferase family 39 protein [Lewinellaceae bacterium]